MSAKQQSQHARNGQTITPPPESFWDLIPRPFLTSHALKELDRRNSQSRGVKFPSTCPQTAVHGQHLQRLAMQGGADLGDLRGHPNPDMAETSATPQTIPVSVGKKSKKSSAYDANIEQILGDTVGFPKPQYYTKNNGGIIPKPSNFEELRSECLRQRDPPIAVTVEDFTKFVNLADDAPDEGHVMDDVVSQIRGPDEHIFSQKKMICNNYVSLIDGERSLVTLQPDFCDGVELPKINRIIRQSLGQYIQPSTNADYPILPNFFHEAKGPEGNLKVLKRQIFLDGCMGARGMHRLRSYGQKSTSIYDNNAYTITSTYGWGILTIFGVWPTAQIDSDRSGDTSYHMAEIGRWYLTRLDDKSTFEEGVTAFRNLRDWAKVQRDEVIQQVNQSLTRNLSDESIDLASPTNMKGGIGLDAIDESDGDHYQSGEDEEQDGRSRPGEPPSSTSNEDMEVKTTGPNLQPTKRPHSRVSISNTSSDELALSPPKKPVDKRPKSS